MRDAKYRSGEDAVWAHYGLPASGRTEAEVDLPHLGTRVRVQMTGRGAPVLFVHGGPSVGSGFAPLVPRLPDFRCIVIDRPGCGLSAPIDYAQRPPRELAVAVLEGVLDGLGLARVDVVASSLGGAWAQWFTQARPERVRALVQLGAPAFLPEMDRSAILFHRLLSLPLVGALIASSRQDARSVAAAFRRMGHGKSIDEGRWPAEFFTFGASIANDSDTWKNERALIRTLIGWSGMKPGAPRVDDAALAGPHPTLWYWGEHEPFAPRSALERIVASNPNATLHLAPGAGHLPWLDDPARAAEAIRRHLGDAHRRPREAMREQAVEA